LPATLAAEEALTRHWLQALDYGQGTDADAGHPYRLFQGLAVARKALVQAHAAQSLAGLLQTCPATVAALQGVLPFMRPPHQLITQQPSLQEQLQTATPQQQQRQSNISSSSSSSSSISQQLSGAVTDGKAGGIPSLMELLPASQQAWLLADVVTGLLLHQHADDASSSSSSTSTSTSSSR
jgi:hypothetical protein